MHCGVKYTFIKLAYCVRTRVMFVEKLASSCKEDVCPPTILHECSLGNSQNVTEAAWHSGIFFGAKYRCATWENSPCWVQRLMFCKANASLA